MKKKALIALSAVLVVVLAVGSSLALQTSSTNGVNVMTFGEVEIAQHEYERATDENGKWYSLTDENGNVVVDKYGYKPDKLQPFTQNKPIAPSFYANVEGTMIWDDRNGNQNASGEGSHQQSWKEVGAPGSNQLFDSSVKNVIDKFVFVENTGDNSAFYRTIIAIELPEGVSEDVIHLNFNGNSRFDYNATEADVQNSENSDKFIAEIGGVRYIIYTVTYTEELTPGEVSRPSLLQVYLDPKTTNEDVALFKGSLDILVFSQATQVFDEDVTANMALESAFGKVETNLPWDDATFTKPLANNNTLEVNKNLILIDEPLFNAVDIDSPTVINGNGYTVTHVITSADKYDWTNGVIPSGVLFASSNGSKITVQDITFTGNTHGIQAGYWDGTGLNFNTLFKNVKILNLNVPSYTTDEIGGRILGTGLLSYGNVEMDNVEISGTTQTELDGGADVIYDYTMVNGTAKINNSKIGYMRVQRHVTNLKITGNTEIDCIEFSFVKSRTDKSTINVELDDTVTIKKVIVQDEEMTFEEWLTR